MKKQDTSSDITRPWLSWVVAAGLLLVMGATLLPLLHVPMTTFRWIYAAGALTVLIGRLFMPYRGDNLRVKRLMRIEVWAGLFFCAGAALMWVRGNLVGSTDWLAFTMAGGAISVYTSIMIPRASRKR